MKSMFFAHSANCAGSWEPLHEHLGKVASRAKEFASAFGCSDEAWVAGLLHDLGKYGERFQDRLRGRDRGLDHWSIGAYLALREYKAAGIATALAVQGHHVGLQRLDSLKELKPAQLSRSYPLGLAVTETDVNKLLNRLNADGLVLPTPFSSCYQHASKAVSGMLDIRMLFSALVDADFLETEAHFEADPNGTIGNRQSGLALLPTQALEAMAKHIEKLRQDSGSSQSLNQLREDLLRSCLEAAALSGNLFTLSAPTGSGKTLAMLAFALRRADLKNLRRVVVVIPYLSIIEQTASIYRSIFEAVFGQHYVLEHHSLAGTRHSDGNLEGIDRDSVHEAERRARQLAENWDAPLIVTTSVQFLESLFGDRPSACRKLHRVAQSVVMFDEVQTLPSRLCIPTLAALSRLAERYGCTVVLSTATQPAFTHLNDHVRWHCDLGWQPSEIAPLNLGLYEGARRTRLVWPNLEAKTSWKDLADELLALRQVLCIVNLKRHAAMLAKTLRALLCPGLYHLSTNMCPAHRLDVLNCVRRLLEQGQPCCLISTQCVEAGVDVDFPTVYRAFGPLEAVAQAAGRCNRNGNLNRRGEVHVFIPEDDGQRLYPGGAYEQGADVTRMLLKDRTADGMDIHDPALYNLYYRWLYDLSRPDQLNRELIDSLQRRDFVDVAKHYRLIEQSTINVLVPYDPR